MSLLREEDRQYLINFFNEKLVDPVKIVYFTQKLECQFCEDTRNIYEEVSGLNPKITLEVYNFTTDRDKAAEYGIDKIPGAAILGKEDYGIRFFGIPSGYEFMSLVEAIVRASRGETELEDTTKERLREIQQPVHIEVLVTPTCPYCPRMVTLAHQFAVENPNIRADMVEVTEFPYIANKYSVYGVPKTVINGGHGIEGAVPEHVFLEHLLSSLEEESENGKSSLITP